MGLPRWSKATERGASINRLTALKRNKPANPVNGLTELHVNRRFILKKQSAATRIVCETDVNDDPFS